jgi:hypothetical protein
MKRALQTVSQESSRPDLAIVCPVPDPVRIPLPQPSDQATDVQHGQCVLWRWKYNFSVHFTSGVFEPDSVKAVEQPDGWYETPSLRVVGPPRHVTICTYSLPDSNPPDVDPPPPPNVIIVDNSSPWPGEK